MANLAFPQLSSGAQVQYPFRRQRLLQSPANAFSDGSMLTSNLNTLAQTMFELPYTELTAVDQAALQNLFAACQGPFLPFVFIDPAGNMLSYSADLTIGNWICDPLLTIQTGIADPFGGNTAFLLTNAAQVDQKITQTLLVPADYRYCFSVYASSASSPTLLLERSSASSQTTSYSIGSNWTRLVSSGRLNDSAMTLSVSIGVPAGQEVSVFGPQLEPQVSPSRYRPTPASGGVYQNAHFLGDSITFQSDAPGLFSTLISIEAT